MFRCSMCPWEWSLNLRWSGQNEVTPESPRPSLDSACAPVVQKGARARPHRPPSPSHTHSTRRNRRRPPHRPLSPFPTPPTKPRSAAPPTADRYTAPLTVAAAMHPPQPHASPHPPHHTPNRTPSDLGASAWPGKRTSISGSRIAGHERNYLGEHPRGAIERQFYPPICARGPLNGHLNT